MDTQAVVDIVERIVALDVPAAERDAVVAALTDVRRVRSWAEAVEARLVGALGRVSSFPEKVLADAQCITFRDAEHLVERSDLLGRLPALAEALEQGAVHAAHVDVVVRAMDSLEPRQRPAFAAEADTIVGRACGRAPDAFSRSLRPLLDRLRGDGMERLQRQRRDARLRTWVDRQGMWRFSGAVDPLTGVAVDAALRAKVEALFRQRVPDTAPSDPSERQAHLAALAFVELVTAPRGPPSVGGRSRPAWLAVIDATEPCTEAGPVIDWGIPVEIPARVLAALAGTADIDVVVIRNGVVLHAPGQLNLGRSTRVANRAQRRALRGLYRTCAIPGCSVHYDRCKLHHVLWWRNGGTTDLDNLLPLCERHHHKVHDDGWVLTLNPLDRSLAVRLPDGQVLGTGPPQRRAA